MKRLILHSLILIFFSFGINCQIDESNRKNPPEYFMFKLPEPKLTGALSVEQALLERRSVRTYKDIALTIEDISQMLWAAQGITEKKHGLRTAPSAGALYPLEIYLFAGKVNNLLAGIYKYYPSDHSLNLKIHGDKRQELSRAALSQGAIADAPAVLVITGVPERLQTKYGARSQKYMYIETGHAAQNVMLQGVSLNLGVAVIGAFNDDKVSGLLRLSDNEIPLYILPFGKK